MINTLKKINDGELIILPDGRVITNPEIFNNPSKKRLSPEAQSIVNNAPMTRLALMGQTSKSN